MRSEVEKLSTDRLPGFLEEFPLGGGQQVFALVRLAFWDRPGAVVLLRPERAAGMDEQDLHACGRLRKSRMPALIFVMALDLAVRRPRFPRVAGRTGGGDRRSFNGLMSAPKSAVFAN